MLQVCDHCTARYAVGLPACPQCGAREFHFSSDENQAPVSAPAPLSPAPHLVPPAAPLVPLLEVPAPLAAIHGAQEAQVSGTVPGEGGFLVPPQPATP